MKKLMIIATVALCASLANAAAFSWKTTGDMTNAGGTTLTAMDPSGSFALVYLGSDAGAIDWTTATVVDTAKPNFTTSMGTASAKTSKSFVFDMNDYGNGDIFGVVFQADNGSLYYLQQDGANYKPTYTISGLADDSSNLADFNFASSKFYGSTAASAAIAAPEPTSAMLLLLGMAGLALKRKRA